MARRSLPIAGNVNPRSIHEASFGALGPTLQRPVSRSTATSAAADAEHWSDELTSAMEEIVPPEAPIACRSGCAYCCHLKVLVTAPEAIHMVETLRAKADDEALAELRTRVIAADEKTHGMTTAQRTAARIPCPMLVNQLCIVHEARPLSCRGANSFDAEVCRASLEEPAKAGDFRFYRPQVQVNEALRAGVSMAASSNQLDGTLLEMNAALRILLTRPHVADEWGTGRRDAFTAARDDEFARLVMKANAKR